MILSRLISVRERHVDKAKAAVWASKVALTERINAHEQQIDALHQYQHFQEKEKVRLFAELSGHSVSLMQVEVYNDAVASLKEGLRQQKQRVQEAESLAEEARRELDFAREQLRDALRRKEKLDTLTDELALNDRLQSERQEERLSEEITEASQTLFPGSLPASDLGHAWAQ